jgi:hypothetical protein
MAPAGEIRLPYKANQLIPAVSMEKKQLKLNFKLWAGRFMS